jgi:hypothetical protein
VLLVLSVEEIVHLIHHQRRRIRWIRWIRRIFVIKIRTALIRTALIRIFVVQSISSGYIFSPLVTVPFNLSSRQQLHQVRR